MKTKSLLASFLTLAVLLVLAVSPAAGKPVAAGPEGEPVPPFTAVDLEGKEVSLEDFKGRVVVISFWATWCSACSKQVPALQELHRQYRDKGVAVIGLSLDFDQLDRVREHVRENDIGYPVLLTTISVAQQYGVRAIPYTLIIDKDHKLFKRYIGPMPFGEFKKDVEALL